MSFEAEQAGVRPPLPGCCCFWQSAAGDGAQETSNPVAEVRRTIAIITGKAGSGKDTLASHIGEHHGLPTISYSNILRYPLSPFEKELSAQGVRSRPGEIAGCCFPASISEPFLGRCTRGSLTIG